MEGALPWALKSQGKLVDMASLPTPDGNSARKGEGGRGRQRERERHGGKQISKKLVRETSPRNWSILYCSEGLLYFLIVHRDQWVIQNYAVSAALTLIETRLSLCIPVLGDLYHLPPESQLTFYSPFLIRVIVLFFPKSGATLRKH